MQKVAKKKKRSAEEKRTGIQEALERRGKFDFDYIPFAGKWTPPDGSYPYRRKFPDSLLVGFWRTVMCLFGPILTKVWFGARVTGRKNLKELKGKGALCVCNHISYLDTLFVRQAVGHWRSYHTMTQNNNKKGFGGHVIRHGGMLPFSENYSAMKNLNAEMDRLLKKGKIINFYAEKAMWTGYRKPRPMKEGVFTYAVKFNVPVIPIFCTFGKHKSGRIKKLRINILPPVYPDEGLPRRERIAKMQGEAQQSWKEFYERAYGIPLEYLKKE